MIAFITVIKIFPLFFRGFIAFYHGDNL